ncbi:LysR family transcriptional regulator [Basilea psittacipulmonis]|uniref:LysR family transcriptional regulator n=1 Tax=Basilea psittacipulmonis TaxID=1472345 RepID=UPI00068A2CF5|nr:LysR family transcriptional regulator [Basilea psittacipulmonis]
MYDFKSMVVFVEVVKSGSMNIAAEKLEMTPSAVTQHIKKLEQSLSIKLFNRTTRKLSLTEAGEAFYQHSVLMKQQADKAFQAIDIIREKAIGELTITCVTGLMDSLLIKAFKHILDKNPEFNLSIYFEDAVVDLFEKRVDLALRVGTGSLQDHMIATHLYDLEMVVCASPSYMSRFKRLQSPDQIAHLNWISHHNNRFNLLEFTKEGERITLEPRYRIRCNTLYNSRQLALNGLGISIQPKLDVAQYLASGELVQLCPGWQLPIAPLYLVRLQRIQSEKVRLASELIIKYFEKIKNMKELDSAHLMDVDFII